jgi:hypothetical protein
MYDLSAQPSHVTSLPPPLMPITSLTFSTPQRVISITQVPITVASRGQHNVTIRLTAADVALWWPNGVNPAAPDALPALHNITVTMCVDPRLFVNSMLCALHCVQSCFTMSNLFDSHL